MQQHTQICEYIQYHLNFSSKDKNSVKKKKTVQWNIHTVQLGLEIAVLLTCITEAKRKNKVIILIQNSDN